MKNDKFPGEDGLPAEFYKTVIDELSEQLLELYNNIVLSGEIPVSQKNAIIKLLFKKGDYRQLKNWRPVSLLNCDYKILSKMMTYRLQNFMDKLTPTEQKCGVQGRQIRDIIRNLDTTLEEMEEEGGYLILIDQEKAFDRVNHTYMSATLKKMGIQGKFLEVIEAMYANITSQVCINGALTEKIHIERSVRQGCPFSMLIFVLCSVPLLNMINQEEKLGVFTKRNRKIKVQAYADDTTLTINKPTDFKIIQQVYDKHARASEAKINIETKEIL